jgi:hypothetical protein
MRKTREPGNTLPEARLRGEMSRGALSSSNASGQHGYQVGPLGESPFATEGAASDDGWDRHAVIKQRGASRRR